MKIAVIGAGSWGTALSQVLANSNHDVALWARRDAVAQGINENHINPEYLSDNLLSKRIWATTQYSEALMDAEACVIVTPSMHLRATATALKSHGMNDRIPVVICSKGVELNSGKLPIEVIADEIGHAERIAVLSGPTHAEEVIRGIPSGAVSASEDPGCASFFQDLFATDTFRTYASDDAIGVELCGAFKNVIAIAVGVAYGLGMGDDTAAMLITRGLAEMSRMVVACGGNALTCLGLAGAGDMVVTCMSRHSRNRRFGEDYIAQGKTLKDFEHDTHMVVEGALACKTLETLSTKHGIELPLTDALRSIIWDGADVNACARTLIDRPLKQEIYGM